MDETLKSALLATLVALSLLFSACGSDDSSGPSGAGVGTNLDLLDTETTLELEAEPAEDDTTASLLESQSFLAGLWPSGRPSDEVLTCIEDRGVDPLASDLTMTDEELLTATVATTICAPDVMADSYAAGATIPTGTTSTDTKCLAAETFRHLATLTIDEATAAITANIPGPLRIEIAAKAEAACDLTVDQIQAIFDAA